MTPTKLLEVIATIETRVNEHGRAFYDHDVPCGRADTASTDRPGDDDALPHVMWMCEQVRMLVNELHTPNLPLREISKRLDKVNRWLGFIQGVLWMMGLTSIDESRKLNTTTTNNDESST